MIAKKMSIALVTFLMLSAILIGTASACTNTDSNPKSTQCSQQDQCSWQSYCSCLQLPKSTVTMITTTPLGVYPFQDTFTNVPKGYDVTNAAYNAWCADLLTVIHINVAYTTTTLSSSLCKSPCFGSSAQWNMVNYMLNHKQGTGQDVQAAIWLAFGFTATQINTLGDVGPVSATAWAMYNAAKAYGGCSNICFDKIIAVIVCIPGYQTTLIELKNPCYCNWGCNDNQNNWGCNDNQNNWGCN